MMVVSQLGWLKIAVYSRPQIGPCPGSSQLKWLNLFVCRRNRAGVFERSVPKIRVVTQDQQGGIDAWSLNLVTIMPVGSQFEHPLLTGIKMGVVENLSNDVLL